MEDKEFTDNCAYIESAVQSNSLAQLLGHIAVSLMRSANAQQALVELHVKDFEAAVEDEINSRAETLANEIVEEKAKRSFIGKK